MVARSCKISVHRFRIQRCNSHFGHSSTLVDLHRLLCWFLQLWCLAHLPHPLWAGNVSSLRRTSFFEFWFVGLFSPTFGRDCFPSSFGRWQDSPDDKRTEGAIYKTRNPFCNPFSVPSTTTVIVPQAGTRVAGRAGQRILLFRDELNLALLQRYQAIHQL
jgi:hypothetical protein